MSRFQMVNRMHESNNMWAIKGLGADGPDSNLQEKLKLFGQFVGDWEITEAKYMRADGTWVKMKGEVHFGWIPITLRAAAADKISCLISAEVFLTILSSIMS